MPRIVRAGIHYVSLMLVGAVISYFLKTDISPALAGWFVVATLINVDEEENV